MQQNTDIFKRRFAREKFMLLIIEVDKNFDKIIILLIISFKLEFRTLFKMFFFSKMFFLNGIPETYKNSYFET